MAYSGTYKSIRFRSLLELSMMVHLEGEGLVLGKDVLYENVKISYGKKPRTYIVDFSWPESKTLIEIKPASRADNRNNRLKRKAAEEWCLANGWTYVIVTEEELRSVGKVITLEETATMPDVKLNERAGRALRRKKKRRAKKNGG